MSYITNIFSDTNENGCFRKVLFTGQKSQLVVMNLAPGEVIDKEKHEHVEQLIFLLKGNCLVTLGDAEVQMKEGDVVVVSPDTWHEVKNNGDTHALIYTVYTPPNHIDGRIHQTKEDAEKDVEDEEFGERVA